MKKQYFTPQTCIVKTEYETALMAGSTITMSVQNDNFDSSTMTSLSRHGGLWDDDEADEEF